MPKTTRLLKEEIDSLLLKYNYILLDVYTKATDKHRIMCNRHNEIYLKDFCTLKAGQSLLCCSKEKFKGSNGYSREQIDAMLDKTEYKLVSDNRNIKYDSLVKMYCEKHNKEFMINFALLNRGSKLQCCADESRKRTRTHKIEDVKAFCEKLGFIFLEDTYRGTQSKARFFCKEHGKINITSLDNLKLNRSLKCCKVEKISGSKHWNYNPNLTAEDRAAKRSILGCKLAEWRNSVFTRDNYLCQVCGYDKGHTLNAHHMFNWRDFPELRTDVDNGVTLCKTCHKGFHKEFGVKVNTKEQFEKFKASFVGAEHAR